MNILNINPYILFGTAGLIGAAIRGTICYIKVKEETFNTKFDIGVFSDTLVQGTIAGIAFSVGLPVSYIALCVTAIASAGVDSYMNKFGVKIIPILRQYTLKKK